jgi:integral membrane sensor domain MASE1
MPVLLAAFCLAYFAAAKLGIASSLPPQGVVIIWPPNALVLAILVRIPRSRWWPLFLATVLTEVAADLPDYPLLAAIGYGTVNFGEAAFAATLLTAIDKRAVPLSGLRGFLNFTLCGPIIASGLAALLGAAIYKLASPDLDYLHYWRVFWFGDALGLLLVGTILLTWGR